MIANSALFMACLLVGSYGGLPQIGGFCWKLSRNSESIRINHALSINYLLIDHK